MVLRMTTHGKSCYLLFPFGGSILYKITCLKVIKRSNSKTVTKIGFAVMYQLVLIRTEGGTVSYDPCSNFTFGFDIRNAKYFPRHILAITSNR